jgi:glycine cleavage system H protein
MFTLRDMSIPTDRKYLKSHEWHKTDGEFVTIGITQFAADELTDVTYVALPKIGTMLTANTRFGEIESVKATSDLYTGISGEVVEINDALNHNPATVNTDPFTDGWMIRIKPSNKADLDALLDVAAYAQQTGQ